MQKSITKNFVLSTAYQVLVLITPFITAPYVARVLGVEGVGVYSYTNSIQMYFSMFAALGTVTYGAREISRAREDKKAFTKLFWEIEILTCITTLVCVLTWALWILLAKKYNYYYLIWTLNIIAVAFDISWFYTGLEEFKYIVTQNGIFKILGILAIFISVKKTSDIGIYIGIMASVILLGNASMWIYLPKFLVKIKKSDLSVLRHFKETFVYFIPTIATSIYTVLDKTLIGFITNSESENGYYEQATKIINMAKAVTFNSLNAVLGTRISFLFAQGKDGEIKERLSNSMNYILFFGIGICFGLIAVSQQFVPIFFGKGYEKTGFLLQLMGPLVVIVGISNCLGFQYYNPAGLRKKSTKYIIIGAFANLLFNLLLIPILKSVGAVIGTIIAEGTITILYMHNCNGYYTYQQLFHSGLKKLFAGIVMCSSLLIINGYFEGGIVGLIVKVIIGVVIYCSILYVSKDEFISIYGLKIIKKIIRRGTEHA